MFVGLPEREGQMLGELLRGGEVGYELQLDPVAPVVVGVYPMRPVTRELTPRPANVALPTLPASHDALDGRCETRRKMAWLDDKSRSPGSR